jgi:hypothetical protein
MEIVQEMYEVSQYHSFYVNFKKVAYFSDKNASMIRSFKKSLQTVLSFLGCSFLKSK